MSKTSKILISIVLSLILIIGITTITLAYRGRGYGRGYGRDSRGHSGRFLGRRLNALRYNSDTKLRLTANQESKLGKIFINHQAKAFPIKRKLRDSYYNGNRDSSAKLEKQISVLHKEFETQIKSVLTPAQRKVFEQEVTYVRGYGRRRGYGHRRGYGGRQGRGGECY